MAPGSTSESPRKHREKGHPEWELANRIDQLIGWAKAGKARDNYLIDIDNVDRMREDLIAIVRDCGFSRLAADLDRCEHGHHSNDTCGNCPGSVSTGNLILARLHPDVVTHGHADVPWDVLPRIGTDAHGEPIYVRWHRPVGRQEDD